MTARTNEPLGRRMELGGPSDVGSVREPFAPRGRPTNSLWSGISGGRWAFVTEASLPDDEGNYCPTGL